MPLGSDSPPGDGRSEDRAATVWGKGGRSPSSGPNTHSVPSRSRQSAAEQTGVEGPGIIALVWV